MREIKFRAWDGREMHYGTPLFNKLGAFLVTEKNPLICDQYGYIEITEFIKADFFMEFTGMRDRNGKDIYEGDLLIQFEGEYYETSPRSVGWDNENGGWCLFHAGGHLHVTLGGFKEGLKIIGNIYENPELLKER